MRAAVGDDAMKSRNSREVKANDSRPSCVARAPVRTRSNVSMHSHYHTIASLVLILILLHHASTRLHCMADFMRWSPLVCAGHLRASSVLAVPKRAHTARAALLASATVERATSLCERVCRCVLYGPASGVAIRACIRTCTPHTRKRACLCVCVRPWHVTIARVILSALAFQLQSHKSRELAISRHKNMTQRFVICALQDVS